MRNFSFRALAGIMFSSLLFCTQLQAAERVVDSVYGPVKLNGVPQRVVALDENALDVALALGVQPVGALASRGGTDVPDYLKDKAGKIALVGSVREPNLEAILTLQPDLILASSELPRAQYDRLSLIAPTIVPKGGSFQDWRTVNSLYALALDKQDEGAALEDEIDARSVALRERLSGSPQVSVIRWNPQGPFIMSSRLFVGQLLDAVGLKPNELSTQTKKPHTDILSLENLSKADADWIFLATLNSDGQKALEEARKQPAFNRLGAVKNGHVVSVDGQIWSSSAGYLAAHRILDDVEKALLD
ncbi:iron-siderophore ABC transporter substrate-binding protein [Pseudomonas sp. KSR10]|jgi:iron complex transport system substrate-binding protein|uniref:ABC transporter substrate-binding protein n=1 Tax=Stutzerimonas stutzeri TaxID=316 RepID=A0A0D9AP46_STUST|nr:MULTISPECIES: iron-siderophore ABC transporter substrate-binding protein [Pseudomonadaceae]KJH82459.1 ABC transporter substrate-binding protein [Stutzerimonas stutzeri]MCG6538868.1 iron-siderophore ABC transporter substrate-binding protein [Pseudomonas sp. KSR10]